MDKEKLKYNKRQIILIKKKIQDYLENKIHIDWLIKDLEALTKSIIECPKEWSEEFIAFINELELSYANALYEKRKHFSPSEKLEILQTLKSMQVLIEKYEIQYLSDLEDE